MIKFYWAHKNLGCFGLSIGSRFYMDIFNRPYLGVYVNTFHGRWWFNILRFKMVHKEKF